MHQKYALGLTIVCKQFRIIWDLIRSLLQVIFSKELNQNQDIVSFLPSISSESPFLLFLSHIKYPGRTLRISYEKHIFFL